MWAWISNNATQIGVLLTALPILFAVVQFILAKRFEARRVRFETYHSLIKQLVERENPQLPMRLDRQVAVVYELRNFPHYYPVTLRILQGLKVSWSAYGPENKRGRLLTEIDLAIEHISAKLRCPLWPKLAQKSEAA